MLRGRLRGVLCLGVLGVWLLLLAPGLSAQPSDLDVRLTSGVWLDHNAGLRGLAIYTIAVDPERPTRMYAGGEGFLYRSRDGGETWDVVERVAQSGQARSAPALGEEEAVAVDIDGLTNEQVDAVDARLRELEEELFREVEEQSGEVVATLAVEEAQDELLDEALLDVLEDPLEDRPQEDLGPLDELRLAPDNRFTQIVVDPFEPAYVYAASGRGVLRSEDFGATWSEYYGGVGDEERRVTALVRNRHRTVLATLGGLFVLEAEETQWRRPVGAPNEDVRFVVAAPGHPDRLYAIAGGRVYRSEDGGATWIPRTIPTGLSPDGVGNLAVSPSDRDLLYVATNDGVMVSRDAGDRFELLGSLGLVDRTVTWVAVAGQAVLAATPAGVYVNPDGELWSPLQDGLTSPRVEQLAVLADETLIWAATAQGIFRLMARGEVTADAGAARRARESWAYEPDLGQTLRAALLYYGYDEIPVDAWAARIFWSRFLPTASLRYRIQERRRLREDFVPDDLGRARRNERDFFTEEDDELQFFLVWRLDTVIQDSREVRARSTAERQVRRRRALVQRVIRVYDTRQSLLLRMAEGRSATLRRQLTDRLRLEELTARLDMFTGGYFSAFSAVGRP